MFSFLRKVIGPYLVHQQPIKTCPHALSRVLQYGVIHQNNMVLLYCCRLEVGTCTGTDCGDEAGQWLSRFLGREGLRLYSAARGIDKMNLKDTDIMGPIELVAREDEVALLNL